MKRDTPGGRAAPQESKAAFLNRLAAMGRLDKEKRNSVVCALLGHSRIQSICWGYYNCGRCSAQVGDSLASIYPGAEQAVVIGHNCVTCRKNFKALGWQDKLYAPDPFKVKK